MPLIDYLPALVAFLCGAAAIYLLMAPRLGRASAERDAARTIGEDLLRRIAELEREVEAASRLADARGRALDLDNAELRRRIDELAGEIMRRAS